MPFADWPWSVIAPAHWLRMKSDVLNTNSTHTDIAYAYFACTTQLWLYTGYVRHVRHAARSLNMPSCHSIRSWIIAHTFIRLSALNKQIMSDYWKIYSWAWPSSFTEVYKLYNSLIHTTKHHWMCIPLYIYIYIYIYCIYIYIYIYIYIPQTNGWTDGQKDV